MPNSAQTLIDYSQNHFLTVSSVLALFYLTTIAIGRLFSPLLDQSSLMNSPKKDGDDDVPVKDPVKYGELVILGYNGSLPNGDRGRRKSRFALYRRAKANGVKPSAVHILNTPQDSKAVHSRGQHSISFTLSRNQTVVVEYCHDNNTDMFQIGRSTESPIDFVVTDTSGGGKEGEDPSIAPSTISRFACRIVCERNPPYTARIYAAGFDSSKNIFLGVSRFIIQQQRFLIKEYFRF